VLVNNVGIGSGQGTQPSDEGVDAIQDMFDTNVFGTPGSPAR
jgi:short-subunit dehydrogenase